MKPLKTKHLIPAAVLLSLSASYIAMDAKKVSTKIVAPKQEATNFTTRLRTYPFHATEFEKVSEALTFMAYDKKAGADKETFFVDNGSDKSLSALELEISYFNGQRKLIHRRTIEIEQEFPPKETRKVDIKTWDLQKSYHYINSVPSSKGSTPYTVAFKVLSFTES